MMQRQARQLLQEQAQNLSINIEFKKGCFIKAALFVYNNYVLKFRCFVKSADFAGLSAKV